MSESEREIKRETPTVREQAVLCSVAIQNIVGIYISCTLVT